MYYVNNIT